MNSASLEFYLRRFFRNTILGTLLILIPCLIAVGWGFKHYESAVHERLQRTELVGSLEVLLSDVFAEVEAWRTLRNPASKMLVYQYWPQVWHSFNALAQASADLELQPLKKQLIRQELNHWRIIDISEKRLNSQTHYLYREVITPANRRIFNLSSDLIDYSRSANNTALLAVVADIRGHSARLATILSGLSSDIPGQTWSDYWHHYNILQISLSELYKANLESVRPLTNSLLQELETYHINAVTMQGLQQQKNAYSLNALENKSYLLHIEMGETLDGIRKRLGEIEADTQQDLQQKLFLALLVSLAVGIVATYLLNKWRQELARTIGHPIRRIVQSGELIAAGDTSTRLPKSSRIEEIDQLINAVVKIRGIVGENLTSMEERIRAQKVTSELNNAYHQSENLTQFCHRALATICQEINAISGALFISEGVGARSRVLFKAGYNLDSGRTRQYLRGIDGVLREVFESGVAQKIDVHGDDLCVETTTVNVSIHTLEVFPVVHGVKTIGLLEVLFSKDQEAERDFLHRSLDKLAVLIQSRLEAQQTRELLHQAQQQKEQLDKVNDELTNQTHALQQSQAELEMQADELKISNTQLMEQSKDIIKKNARLEFLNDELKELSRKLQHANEQKSIFLSKVSHELRTPLNSIMVLTQTLLRDKGNYTNEQSESLEIILQSGQDLLGLINDLLDLAKIEAGKMQFVFDDLALNEFVERLTKQFAPIAEKKGLHWKVITSEDLPVSIHTDGKRLAQVLRNFLSNAFKFTLEGDIKLHVTADDDTVKFTVIDTGIGIKEDAQKKIFEAFTQADEDTNRKFEGTGLGLSISKSIAQSLGAKIAFASTSGKGSSFSISVPVSGPAASYSSETELPVCAWLGRNNEKFRYVESCCTDIAELRQTSLHDLKGKLKHDVKLLILSGDSDEWQEGFDHSVVETWLTGFVRFGKIVVLVTDTLQPSLKWLETQPCTILRWNKAGKKALKRIISDMFSEPAKAFSSAELPASPPLAPEAHPPLPETSAKGDITEFTSNQTGTTLESEGSDDASLNMRFENTFQVLLVDDDMRSLFGLSVFLKRAGLVTHLADSVELAKQKLIEHPVHLIITDIMMPEEDGYVLLEYLQSNSRMAAIPVIVSTAKDLPEEKERCSELGYEHFLPKPVEPSQLLALLKRLLEPVGI